MTDQDERTCDQCARKATRWVYTDDDATICGDCLDAHERALDAATAVAWGDLPSGVQDYFDGDRGRVRRTVAAAVKTYLEWPGE